MDPRARLTRDIVRLILAAALLSAPVFLFAEEFDREHILRVAASNGVTAVLCAGLLALLRRGSVEPVARGLVLGLFTLVGVLAWTNGEDVHVNVINFVLVTLLASVLLGRASLLAVGALSAAEMCAIAWRTARAAPGEELTEARFESIAQFLPTFAVVVLVLWLHSANRSKRELAPSDDRH
ncbi:MAG: hypothetical protein R3F49_18175 [Planctomycetota bacterium]